MNSFEGITSYTTNPMQRYVSTEWVASKNTTFIKKNILSRLAHLGLVPLSIITCALDTIIGLGTGLGSIAIGGTNRELFQFAHKHLEASGAMAPISYLNILRTLNPEANISYDEKSKTNLVLEDYGIIKLKHPIVSASGNGFITHYAHISLKNLARSCYRSDNVFHRHISSRLTFGLLAIASVITRAVDAAIGTIAGMFSLVTFGKILWVNNLAYRALQAPAIAQDLFYCTNKLINPWTGTY